MDSLKATMALALAGDPVEGGWCFDLTDEEYSDPHAHNMRIDFLRQADSAIAAFEQALLQPEVVEAAAKEMHADGAFGSSVWSADGMGERQLLEGPRVLGEDERQAWIARAKSALQAALAAAKGTEGGE